MVFCAACTRTTLSHDHLEILNKAHKLAIGIDMKELLAVYGFAACSQHDNKLSTDVRVDYHSETARSNELQEGVIFDHL